MEGTGIFVEGMRFNKDHGEDIPAWKWDELSNIKDDKRRAQVDALKLFAAFIEHTDSKSIQNKLICLSNLDANGLCNEPFLYIPDLGNTLGTTDSILEKVLSKRDTCVTLIETSIRYIM